MFFSSIKEINRLISKGNVKHLLLKKTDVLKTSILVFPGKKVWRNAPALRSKKVQGIFRETFILALSCLAVFLLENRISDFF